MMMGCEVISAHQVLWSGISIPCVKMAIDIQPQPNQRVYPTFPSGRCCREVFGNSPLDPIQSAANLFAMTATAFLDLKQRAATLTEKERQDLSAYLIRLGHERSAWKKETARRLNEMAKGKRTSVADLRKQLGHG